MNCKESDDEDLLCELGDKGSYEVERIEGVLNDLLILHLCSIKNSSGRLRRDGFKLFGLNTHSRIHTKKNDIYIHTL